MILKKRILPAFILLIFAGFRIDAQVIPEDKIRGIWLSENKDGKIEIFRTGNTYSGKLIWGKDELDVSGNLRRDTLNPDPKLRSRFLKGMIFLTGLVYEDGKWKDGKIYDSLSGKTYSVVITLKGNNLELRGYIGVPLLGKTTTWQRIN